MKSFPLVKSCTEGEYVGNQKVNIWLLWQRCYLQSLYTHWDTYGEFLFVKHQIVVLSVHMGVMSTHTTAISHLLLRPHLDVSHLGGASTQTNSTQGAAWDDNGRARATCPSWWTGSREHSGVAFCAMALGQRVHNSDVTLKAFLYRRQVDAFQSKHKTLGDISEGNGMPAHCSWAVLFSLLVTIWLIWQLHFTLSSYQRFSWVWKNGPVPVWGHD